MENCRLCRAKAADKKGSHIIPHFLLKRIENVDGRTERDYGLGFVIQDSGVESHFERSVPVDTLEKVYGELAEEDIERNHHPYIVDYFFCKRCEERFAKIESAYASTLHKKGVENYDSGVSAELGLLFWASIIWRVSINNKAGIRLTKVQEETLRRILDRCLEPEVANIELESMRSSKDINKLSYRLLRCPDYSLNNPTHFVFGINTKNPYTLLIDEYILLFSFKDNYNDYLNNSFFGLGADVISAPTNNRCTNEMVHVIKAAQLDDVSRNMMRHRADTFLETISKKLDKAYTKIGGAGSVMPANMKREILEEITSSQKKLGKKYTPDDFVDSAYKVMRKYHSFE